MRKTRKNVMKASGIAVRFQHSVISFPAEKQKNLQGYPFQQLVVRFKFSARQELEAGGAGRSGKFGEIVLLMALECGLGVKLQRGDGFLERAEDFAEIGLSDGNGGAGGGSGNDLKKKFVARSIRIAGVVAVEGGFGGDEAAVAPVKRDALNDGFVGGAGPIGIRRSDEGAAGLGGGLGIHGKLKMTFGESGVGIGVGGNLDGGDQQGAGLIGLELLLGLEGRTVGEVFFGERVGSGIAEGDAVSGIVVNGECGITGRVF
jgi:hypothetical protein